MLPEGPAADSAHCWICGEPGAQLWKQGNLDRRLVPEDLRITDSRYGTTLPLLRCAACGFLFARADDITRLNALYAALDDPAYQEGEANRALQMRKLLKSAVKLRPGARSVLDIGAAAGLLLLEARALGLEGEGVEPSRSLARVAAAHGARVHEGVLPHPALDGKTFDLVCAIDVIEHVADPLALLRSAAAHLAPGGVLAVVTPDAGSVAARLLGQRWWHFRLAHVGYFDRHSAQIAFERAGLVLRRVERAGWVFDVGYLAERMERYLPVAALNRFARRTPGLRAVYRWVIPLDLRDSYLFLLSRTDDA